MAAELLKLLAHHGRNAKKGQRKLKAVKPNRRAELNYTGGVTGHHTSDSCCHKVYSAA
jgi:hypothetical protein